MITLFVVCKNTGSIKRTITCDIDDVEGQIRPGEILIEYSDGIGDDTHYWTVEEGFAEYPPRPGDWAVWTGTAWADPRSPEDVASWLKQVRDGGIARVNQWANIVRKSYITPIEGQSTVYELKRKQAEAYLADPSPDPLHYPLIMAEVGITADTPEAVAQVYLTMNELMIAALAQSENIRLGVIRQIETAETESSIASILTEFEELIS